MKTIKQIIWQGILVVALGGIFLANAPVGRALAQAPVEESKKAAEITSPPATNWSIAGARFFKRAVALHEQQARKIAQTTKIGDRFAVMLAQAKENGKVTDEAETAVKELETVLENVRLKHTQNSQLIKEHPGFNDEGKVIEEESAQNTLIELRAGNQAVRELGKEAFKSLKAAGQALRAANRPSAINSNQ